MAKRLFDLFWVILGLILLSPLFVIIGLLVFTDSGGPVLFRQRRIGRSGKLFDILKFRTMIKNAEGIGSKITVGGDVRITRVGHFLRKCKLDELPQLVNVFKGEMSLVGPRPEVPEYVSLYPEDKRQKILSVRPGITDLASLEYRDESSILAEADDPHQRYVEEILPRKLDHYIRYVDQRNFWMDFKIILQTLFPLP